MANPPGKFYYNGQSYSSLEEIPEEFRKYLKDENQNGMPDFLENMFGGKLAEVMKNPTFQKFAFKDKIFNNLEQLPPEERQKIREKLEQVNAWFTPGPSSPNPEPSISTNFTFPSSVPSLGGSYSPMRTGPSKVFWVLTAMIGILILGLAMALWILSK